MTHPRAASGATPEARSTAELRAPAERLRYAAHLIRNGAAIPVECDRLRSVLAAVLDQEAVWAGDSGDRYPAETAAVLAVADAVNR